MLNDITESARDWKSAFDQDKNRRYKGSSKKGHCTLIDTDLLRKTNRKNKLAMQAMKEKLLH